jgi:hypothetical protein
LSGLWGNASEPFLGGGVTAMEPCYPTENEQK